MLLDGISAQELMSISVKKRPLFSEYCTKPALS